MMVYIMLKTKSYGVILVLTLSAILGTGIVFADDGAMEINIVVAPATLNLNEGVQECDDVTVHTNISYFDVNRETLKLNDISVDYWTKYDDRYNLVVKFDRTEVKGIVASYVDEDVTLTLTGETLGGDEFTGTDTIRVINSGKTQ
jgi:hypothetical protein